MFNWWLSEKANHWFNQWKFDWFKFRDHYLLKFGPKNVSLKQNKVAYSQKSHLFTKFFITIENQWLTYILLISSWVVIFRKSPSGVWTAILNTRVYNFKNNKHEISIFIYYYLGIKFNNSINMSMYV